MMKCRTARQAKETRRGFPQPYRTKVGDSIGLFRTEDGGPLDYKDTRAALHVYLLLVFVHGDTLLFLGVGRVLMELEEEMLFVGTAKDKNFPPFHRNLDTWFPNFL